MKSKEPELVIGIPKGGESDDEGPTDDMSDKTEEKGDDELSMHASAMYDAVEKGDKAGFVEALKKCLLANESGDSDYTEADSE